MSDEIPEPELTHMEHLVVSMIVKGLQTKEVAKKLGIATSTVKSHLHNVYIKLGVRNRIELLLKVQSEANKAQKESA